MTIPCEKCIVLSFCRARVQSTKYKYVAIAKFCRECYDGSLRLYMDLCTFFHVSEMESLIKKRKSSK